jgi:hypothetical protein
MLDADLLEVLEREEKKHFESQTQNASIPLADTGSDRGQEEDGNARPKKRQKTAHPHLHQYTPARPSPLGQPSSSKKDGKDDDNRIKLDELDLPEVSIHPRPSSASTVPTLPATAATASTATISRPTPLPSGIPARGPKPKGRFNFPPQHQQQYRTLTSPSASESRPPPPTRTTSYTLTSTPTHSSRSDVPPSTSTSAAAAATAPPHHARRNATTVPIPAQPRSAPPTTANPRGPSPVPAVSMSMSVDVPSTTTTDADGANSLKTMAELMAKLDEVRCPLRYLTETP